MKHGDTKYTDCNREITSDTKAQIKNSIKLVFAALSQFQISQEVFHECNNKPYSMKKFEFPDEL